MLSFKCNIFFSNFTHSFDTLWPNMDPKIDFFFRFY